MSYLELRKLVHGDLAIRNVLVRNPGHIEVSDFGMAKIRSKYGDVSISQMFPIKSAAIELLNPRNKAPMFTTKTDVWAFGVTVWEIFSYPDTPYENLKVR